jgi:hypothetical protein
LINDIIQYVSGNCSFKIFPAEVNLKDILQFCFNVLKTLVECNENKASNIQTILDFDRKLENLKIITDENDPKYIFKDFDYEHNLPICKKFPQIIN